MSTQQIPGTFRCDQSGVSVFDQVSVDGTQKYVSQRSPGATIIDLAPIAPGSGQIWDIQSIGIQAYLILGAALSPWYGKLGKLVGGLIPAGRDIHPTSQTSLNSFYSPTILALPPDPSLTFSLWDPAVDSVIPHAPTNAGFPPRPQLPFSQMLAVSGNLQLPQPQQLVPGASIGIGMWWNPSLVGFPNSNGQIQALGLAVVAATYAITYENNV